MPFEVMFEDQPYPLPPELLPLPLDLLPTDAAPDKLALFDSIGRLQRDVTRLSGRLQLNVKTQAEAMAKVEEAVQSVEDRLQEQALVRPPGNVEVRTGVDLTQLAPLFKQLGDQITAVQQRVNPLSEQLGQVKTSYKTKVEDDLFQQLFPVLDSFERLFDQAANVDDPKVQKWLEGVSMIRGQLKTFLRAHGIEEIEALGRPFDPKVYAAIGTEPTDDPALHDKIVRVARTGYRRADEGRILRVPEVFVGRPATEAPRVDPSKLSRQEQLKIQAEAGAAPPPVATAPAPPPSKPKADKPRPRKAEAKAPRAAPPPPPAPAVATTPAASTPAPEPPPVAAVPATTPTAEPAPTTPAGGWVLEPPAAGPTSAPVSPAAAAEPAPAAPEPPFESDGEDKFREIREKALGALAGLFGPTAQVETPTPVKVEGPAEVPAVPTPPPPPASSAGGWGNLKSESTLPTTPPPLPPVEGGELQAGPPAPELAGGGPEYYAAGEAVYNLRMELGLTLKDFWSKAFKGVDPNQAMDLGEAVEREEEPLEEAEVVRLAKGLEMPLEELLARFRPA